MAETNREQRARRRRWLLRGSAASMLALVVGCNVFVWASGRRRFARVEELQPRVVMILGAAVYRDGTVSPILRDRLDTAIELYRRGLATKLLVTGDHRKHTYNEVGAMKAYLLEQAIPETAIVIDHAGFDTYSSMYRARHVFGIERMTVVTQRFHLSRSLYLADAVGIDAQGVVADRRDYHALFVREVASRVKAIVDVMTKREPMFPGPVEPRVL